MMVSSRRGNKRPLLHEPEGESWMARTNFFPQQTKIEDALHKSAGRFLMQISILQIQNKCSIIILPLHKSEASQIVDNCQILVYYLSKCGELFGRFVWRKLNMAQMYFYKFNINAEIYDVYQNNELQEKILNDVFAKIDTDMSYVYGYEDGEEEKPVEYKFCDLLKNSDDLTVTGRLVKIYDGEVESYDRENDTVKQSFETDRAASATFYFDLINEEIAFITRLGLGYLQFGCYFTKLLETKFQEGAFELVLEKNVGELKEKVYNMHRVLRVNCTMIPPNANESEFDNLLGPTVNEFKETGATKYIQGIEIPAKGKKSIQVKTKFFDRIFYALGKGYAELTVEGRDKNNEKIVVNSDADTPYKLPVPEREKDSLTAFREHGKHKISLLLKDKALITMQNVGDENGEETK